MRNPCYVLALSLGLAANATASLQEVRELLLSAVPAAWKRAHAELETQSTPEAGNLKVLCQLYGMGVPQDVGGALAQARSLLAQGTARAEMLRHVGAAVAGGFAGRPGNLGAGLKLLDAAIKAGDDEAAALAGAFRLTHAAAAEGGRALLQTPLGQKYTGGRAWLARSYELGLGGPVDPTKAAEFLATLGSPHSSAALEKVALQRARKADEIAHVASAIPWLRWAAAAGSHEAATELGRMHRGRPAPTAGVIPDLGAALRWYQRAALAGAPGVSTPIRQIRTELGRVTQDDARTHTMLEQWARANVAEGFPESLELLATAFHTGARLLPADPAKARAAYDQLDEQRHPRASALQELFHGTQAMVSRAEDARLHPTQVRAAIPGDVRARYAVGLAFTRDRPEDEEGKAAFTLARRWLEGLCEGGGDPALATLRAGSCKRLADLLRQEGGDVTQLYRLRQLYERCAEHGSIECAALVAETYRDVPLWKGGPTEPDEEAERPWVEKAAKGGDAAAKARWAELNAPPGYFDRLGESAMWGALILLAAFGGLAIFLAGDGKKSNRRY